jgi:pyruvate,orthophosphate dikinase
VRAGGRTVPEGTLVTIDGTGGEVVVGRAPVVAGAAGPHLERLLGWADEVAGGGAGRDEAARLRAAQAVLRPAP